MREYIRVCDIEKYYGTGRTVTKAVDRVSFTVEQGEFVGVMGASGSGKTTLLNMLSTIDRVTAGHIYYENTDITELSEDQVAEFRKKNLGFVFQEYNLLDTLTLEENVMLAMSLRKEKKSVIEKLGGLLQQVLLSVLYHMIQMDYHFQLEYNRNCILMTAGCYGGCYLLALLRCRRRFKKMSIYGLMNADRQNEKNREAHEAWKRILLPISLVFMGIFAWWMFRGVIRDTGEIVGFLVGLVLTIYLFYVGVFLDCVLYQETGKGNLSGGQFVFTQAVFFQNQSHAIYYGNADIPVYHCPFGMRGGVYVQ